MTCVNFGMSKKKGKRPAAAPGGREEELACVAMRTRICERRVAHRKASH